jgi:recombinational DNA repair protein (RecF pathway)
MQHEVDSKSCVICHESQDVNSYSNRQWRRRANTRTCKTCVKNREDKERLENNNKKELQKKQKEKQKTAFRKIQKKQQQSQWWWWWWWWW